MSERSPWYPKTREEFEAYCRAMDEANDQVVESAIAREQAQQGAGDQQARHQTAPVSVDEDAESWITLMMSLDAAKDQPHLRKDLEERVSPEVLRAADECSSFEDFKHRLDQYHRGGLPNA